uniref:Uncharacterized protein n=1 Tax=Tetraselmis sp. GSL018 TaxID=582737 RepID=A0A061SFE9_9CHLO|mmetsp:Transcript_33030/g.78365  ORF Transcript_33030/g.78365 Transcript_33030/m.78365 type:complete len:172 (+) Transcript_33030:356-871(+)
MEGDDSFPSPSKSGSYCPLKSPKGKLTFTSPPVVPRAKPLPRADYTHNPNQLREIGRENSILVDKIAKISTRSDLKESSSKEKESEEVLRKVASIAPAAVNRRKAYDRIAEENRKMYHRLQRVKPSPEIERKKLAAAHKQNEEYKRNCSVHSGAAGKKSNAILRREEGWQG